MTCLHLNKMKNRLSQLVGLRNDVEQTFDNEISLKESTFQSVEAWKSLWRRHDSKLYKVTDEIKNLVKEMQDIEKQFDQLKGSRRQSIINELQIEIDQEVDQLINDQKYKEMFSTVVPIKSSIKYDDASYRSIKMRISEKVDWRYPGLELGSLHKELTRSLTSCDPLYVCDEANNYSDLINSIQLKMTVWTSTRLDDNIKQFNNIYQTRLRKYLIKEKKLDRLPQQQFGFVFSWEFFNYLTTDIVKKYLTQIYDLMRDGGYLMFGYNNCDRECGARSVELMAQSWNTERDLVSFLKELGFADVKAYTIDNDDIVYSEISWIEATKPGELKTIKAHPVLPVVRRR